MKSVTCAACKRSITLPSAPPMINASGRAVRQSRRGVRASHTTIAEQITTARATNSQRCQPSPLARKLKAAPRLNASVQLSRPGITGCGTPGGCRLLSAHHLLSWSSTMTRAESSNHGNALDLAVMRKLPGWPCRPSEPTAILTRAFDIAHATPAKLGMLGMGADVVASMPATDALGRRADAGRQPRFGALELHAHRIGGTRGQRRQLESGDDE